MDFAFAMVAPDVVMVDVVLAWAHHGVGGSGVLVLVEVEESRRRRRRRVQKQM